MGDYCCTLLYRPAPGPVLRPERAADLVGCPTLPHLIDNRLMVSLVRPGRS